MKDYRMLSPEQLFNWAENNTAIMRLRTDRDVLPGGFMAALAPLLTDWLHSRYLETGGFLILRNVNYGGNSFERTTVLQSVKAAWERLSERLRSAPPPADLAPALRTEEQTYQVLVRSCAALARYAILVAVHRLLERGTESAVVRDRLPAPELEQPEPWMKDVARADLRGLFMHAPAAIRFLTRSPSVIPAKIPDELDAAGLLQQRDGKPWVIRYGREATRPYGSNGLNSVD